ncbi:hypothetical protein KY290_001426 [Solanum tuberosum]|uniref:Uncharacterized protein n=1 Tax=Solanum tuberosum TaxID=4113 RepID=A0ABQ7WP41_SOLTU|nr:hypothetical protein KY290_001426 [Solanum tuberosum]
MDDDGSESDSSLEIFAPNLHYLKLSHDFTCRLVDVSSMVKANDNPCQDSDDEEDNCSEDHQDFDDEEDSYSDYYHHDCDDDDEDNSDQDSDDDEDNTYQYSDYVEED